MTKPAKNAEPRAASASPMRLRHIEVFNAIYLSGTISAAAQLLNVSQPSLSKTLQHAEDQLGFKLFRRVRGRLLPTEEAHIIYRETREVYERIEMLQQTCRSLRAGDGGHLRVAVVHAAGLEVAPAAIAEFRRRCPDVTFDVRTYHQEESLRALFDRTSEIAIVWGSALPPRVAAHKIGEGELVVVYPKGLLPETGERVAISSLAGRDIVGITTSGPVGDILSAQFAKLSESLHEIVSAHTFFVAVALAREGVGLTIVDELTARAAADGRVTYKRLDPPVRFDICAAHLEDRPPSHLASRFIDEMRNALSQRLAAEPSPSRAPAPSPAPHRAMPDGA